MIIRDGRDEEAAGLAALQQRSSQIWDDQREFVLAHPEFEDEARDDLARQIPAGFVRVAEVDGEIAGFAVAIPDSDDDFILDGLFVRPERMRQGIGAALVADTAARLASRGVARLTVLANVNALAFYERAGFVAIEIRPTQFLPAMWMELVIPPPSSPA